MTSPRATNKLRIGISACLLGEPVRYDGGDRRNAAIIDTLGDYFDWVPVCPEVGAGLGVPRPSVRLVDLSGQLRALGVADPSLDVTRTLEAFSHDWLDGAQDLSGFILKSRSPSCGLHDTPRFNAQGEEQCRGEGLFTRILIRSYPHLPLEDEIGLQDPHRRQCFVARVQAYAEKIGMI